MIKIKDLCKSYRNQKILKGIDLEIDTGDIYGIIGMSGAGKSTLLNCLTGLEPFDSGTIEIDGLKLETLDREQLRQIRKNIGFIFQNFSLLNRKNVYDNISLPMRCWKMEKDKIDKRVKELAEMVGLSDKLKSKPKELSGGQKQRVAIARALTMNPKYIICDEFTSALDPSNSEAIVKLIMDIAEELNITVVVVTHEMSVVKAMCNKMSILKEGKIIESDYTENIFFKKPEELENLVGEKSLSGIKDRTNITIELSKQQIESPIFYDISNVIDKDYILIDSEILNFRDKKVAIHTLGVYEDDLNKILEYFDSKNIRYELK